MKINKSQFDILEVDNYSKLLTSKTSLEKGFDLLNNDLSIIEDIKNFGKTSDILEKSLNTAGLIKKKVQIHASNGKIYEGYRWVSTNINQQVKQDNSKNIESKEVHKKRGFDENKGDEDIAGKEENLQDKTVESSDEDISNKIKSISESKGKKSQKIKDLASLGVYDTSLIMQLNPDITIKDINYYFKQSGVDYKKFQDTLEENINTSLGNKNEKEINQSPVYKLQEELKSKDLQKVLKSNKQIRAKELGITAKDKFDAYRFKLDQLIGDKMTRSALIYGTGGIGKTFNLEEKLQEYGKIGWDPELDLNEDEYDYRKVTGNTSPTDLYNILYQNRNKLVIFDDADSMWEGGNEEMSNMLKGVLDSTGDRMIHYGNPKAMADGTKVPTDFKFRGQVIFISNLSREKFPQPIVDSRANALDLSMSMDQTLDMLKDIKDKFKYKDANDEEIKISKEDRDDILKVLNELKNDLRVEQVNGRVLGNLAALKVSLTKKGKGDYDNFKKQAMISLDLV